MERINLPASVRTHTRAVQQSNIHAFTHTHTHTDRQAHAYTHMHTLTIAIALVGYILGAIDIAIAEQLLGNASAIIALPFVVQTGCMSS